MILIVVGLYIFTPSSIEPFEILDKYKIYQQQEKTLNRILGKKNITTRMVKHSGIITRDAGQRLIQSASPTKVVFAKQLENKKIFIFKTLKNKKIDYLWFKYKTDEEASDVAKLLKDNGIIVIADKDCQTCLDFTNLGPPGGGIGPNCNTMKSHGSKCRWNTHKQICEMRII